MEVIERFSWTVITLRPYICSICLNYTNILLGGFLWSSHVSKFLLLENSQNLFTKNMCCCYIVVWKAVPKNVFLLAIKTPLKILSLNYMHALAHIRDSSTSLELLNYGFACYHSRNNLFFIFFFSLPWSILEVLLTAVLYEWRI